MAKKAPAKPAAKRKPAKKTPVQPAVEPIEAEVTFESIAWRSWLVSGAKAAALIVELPGGESSRKTGRQHAPAMIRRSAGRLTILIRRTSGIPEPSSAIEIRRDIAQ